jgi:DNA-binding winged helix-turn-helix (wHTH) protein/Tol biopolymer transport system component
MPAPNRLVYEFGPFRFETPACVLIRGDELVRLPHRPATLLRVLLERHGEVVTKDELLDAVWAHTDVSETSLTFAVHQLRQALGQDQDGHAYVETLPKRGYRFVAPVTEVKEAATAPAVVTTDAPATPRDVVDERAPAAKADVAVESAALRLDAGRGGDPVTQLRWRLIALAAATATALVTMVTLQWRGSQHEPWRPPRIARYTALSANWARAESLPPLLGDARRLYFNRQSQPAAIDIASGGVAPIPALAGFSILDVSRTGREFLAVKPGDPGGERGLWIVPLDGTAHRVSDLRVTGVAAWSARGDRIAYAFDRDVFVADRNGSNVQKLISASGNVLRARWSPDATRLRFEVSVIADRIATHSLWEFALGGGPARRLFAGKLDGATVCCGSWTPDGRTYVFQVGPHENANLWVSGVASVGEAEPPPTPLTHGSLSFAAPLVSADGRRIFTVARRRDGELVRLDERSREFMPYLGGLSALWVSFARDGTWMTYQSYPDDALWRARLDGSGKQRLTTAPMLVDGSEPSPDGQWIVFRGRARDGAPLRNYLLPATGGAPVPLDDAEVTQGMASWSLDSQQLVYGDVPEQFGIPTGSEVIRVYDRRTRETRALPDSGGLWTARWSPDGRYIAALTIQGQRLRLYDVAARSWRAYDIDHVTCPTWTRDGRMLYLDTEGGGRRWLRRLRLADGRVERIFDLTDYPMSAYWWTGLSHDDRPILLRTPGGDQIYALELESR